MANGCTVSRRMPVSALPKKYQSLGIKAIESVDARERRAADARRKTAESLFESGRRLLHDRVGARPWAALRAAMAMERDALRMRREPPGGLGLDLAATSRARKRKLDAAAQKLGIDPKALRSIGAATSDKLAKALGTASGAVTPGFSLAANLGKWQKLSSLHAFPLDWGVLPPFDPADPSQFQLFKPPFPLWNIGYEEVESDNFRVRRDYTLNEQLGLVANIAEMDCNDAGSFDLAQAIVDTECVFIYEAPRAGRLEVIVDAMNLFGHHDLRISDEWGWSDQWTHQHNYLSLNVFHPNVAERSLALMSQFDREGNEDATWSVRALTPGNHYYGHMVSNGVVQAGDTFFVGVGTRTFDITRANDVEVHSRSNFQWLLRSVEVRIVN